MWPLLDVRGFFSFPLLAILVSHTLIGTILLNLTAISLRGIWFALFSFALQLHIQCIVAFTSLIFWFHPRLIWKR